MSHISDVMLMKYKVNPSPLYGIPRSLYSYAAFNIVIERSGSGRNEHNAAAKTTRATALIIYYIPALPFMYYRNRQQL